ncbi:MAG TPA: right-handed parallel beta-helix repeat-containing protein [Armatimonadota bacterium]|nr:right-handed parallel beta-helix repeat-containing protein [Armatimonadota bacterium]
MKLSPAAFMSYAHFDDKHERGRLTQFRERLSEEVCFQTGEKFEIFQDRKDIKWGEQGRRRIGESLDASTFFIPIITPNFFKSEECRKELEGFLKREKKLGRSALILPVYYQDTPLLNDQVQRKTDKLAEEIAKRQWADWRELRFEPLTSLQVGKAFDELAAQICEGLKRQAAEAPTGKPAAARKRPRAAGRRPSLPRAMQADRLRPAESAAELAESPRGPSAKTEPWTRVVDALHHGDYTTITAAIEAAQPGDRILVRPGRYEEGLVIEKPLEIIGDGDRDDITVWAVGKDALLFQTTMGRVSNLTLRQVGEGDWYGVDIAQGRLELEDCDISSESLACVAIHGGADPRLRRNRVHDGKRSGVFVYENGQGTLEDNDIFGNASAGVGIKTGGNPILRRNRIYHGRGGGVSVYENGRGTLEDNDIFGNAHDGIAISKGGDPTLRRNRVNGNGFRAVCVYDGGGGDFEDNDLRDSAGGAWEISDDSMPNVKRAGNIE